MKNEIATIKNESVIEKITFNYFTYFIKDDDIKKYQGNGFIKLYEKVDMEIFRFLEKMVHIITHIMSVLMNQN